MAVPKPAILAPPVVCESSGQIALRFGGAVENTAGGGRVVYALPAEASAEVREFLKAWSVAEISPGMKVRLPAGRVFGAGNVLSPDGLSIARDVSPDFGKTADDHWLLTFKKIRPPVPLAGTVAVVATTLGRGYSHWLLEELPRLLMLAPGEVATIIAHGAAAAGREARRLHGFAGRVIEARREEHFACEQLVIPVLPGEAGQPAPEVVRRLAEFAAPLHAGASAFGERIYVSRAKARRRRVVNEDGLWTQLQARGFVCVYLEDLTWAEQINAFRHARLIVGPHGAGLANLAFCRPQTRVVEFFHRAYVNPCFWRLAALAELDYRPVVSAGSEPLAYDGRGGRWDIEADSQAVMDAAFC